jgi:hypothetical protein
MKSALLHIKTSQEAVTYNRNLDGVSSSIRLRLHNYMIVSIYLRTIFITRCEIIDHLHDLDKI